MCKAIDAMMSDAMATGEAKGLAKGKAEGKAEGLAEGKAEGLAEGKAEGLAEGEAKERSRMVSFYVKESRRNHDDDASIRAYWAYSVGHFKQVCQVELWRRMENRCSQNAFLNHHDKWFRNSLSRRFHQS